jgi:hypothetical protein
LRFYSSSDPSKRSLCFVATADDLDSEFGASPLGKAGSRGGGDTTTAPAAETQPNSTEASLPDLYGDLYGDTGEGNLLLKTQVAQVIMRDFLNKIF